jgi:hypothetical protein
MHAEGVWGEWKYSSANFFISTPNGGEWSYSGLGLLFLQENSLQHPLSMGFNETHSRSGRFSCPSEI